MEIPAGLIYQRAEIDIDRFSDAVPTHKPIISVAMDVREIITDVLKIEPDASFEQIWPDTVPISQEVAVRTLTRLMTVRAAKRFSNLRISAGRKDVNGDPDWQNESAKWPSHRSNPDWAFQAATLTCADCADSSLYSGL